MNLQDVTENCSQIVAVESSDAQFHCLVRCIDERAATAFQGESDDHANLLNQHATGNEDMSIAVDFHNQGF